ncbi:BgTH12-05534 [Blumeria graminis f. sp. triticale]|nr:BgTH12-05534 [Blumeria graminis f. sp. triticale]
MKPNRKNGLITNTRHQKDLNHANSTQKPYELDQQCVSRSPHNLTFSANGSIETNVQGLVKENDRPKVVLHNTQSLDMNQQVSNSKTPFALEQPSEIKSINSKLRPTAPQISSRAAELKAQLLARRASSVNSQNRKSSPNLTTSGGKQDLPARPSPKIKNPKGNSSAKKDKKELNLNELILQYSVSEPAAELKSNTKEPARSPPKSNNTNVEPMIQELVENNEPSQKKNLTSQEPLTVTEIKDDLQNIQKDYHADIELKGAASDASEGEIFEDADTEKQEPDLPKLIDKKDSTNITRSSDNSSRNHHGDTPIDVPQYRVLEKVGIRHSPHPAPSLHSTPTIQNNRIAETDYHRQKQPYSIEQSYEISQNQNSGKQEHFQPPHSGYYNMSEVKIGFARAENSRERLIPEPRPIFPSLIDESVPHNADLREWLEITGFHDAQYRNKILSRRRAIAALDAQKERLLAEIESEVRGSLPTALRAQLPPSSMLPPPIPRYKAEHQNETITTDTTTPPINDDFYRVSSNKRFYSQSQEPRIDTGPSKVARIHEKNYGPKVREEEIFDDCRSRFGGYSITNPYSFNRHDCVVPRYRLMSSSSFRNYNNSQECLVDEHRIPTRFAVYENDFYDDEDISETGSRPVEVRGNYRGRSFDPNHRGRGRGRGRGDLQELRGSPEPRLGVPSSTRTSNGKPNRNFTGGSRGSRGGLS